MAEDLQDWQIFVAYEVRITVGRRGEMVVVQLTNRGPGEEFSAPLEQAASAAKEVIQTVDRADYLEESVETTLVTGDRTRLAMSVGRRGAVLRIHSPSGTLDHVLPHGVELARDIALAVLQATEAS